MKLLVTLLRTTDNLEPIIYINEYEPLLTKNCFYRIQLGANI